MGSKTFLEVARELGTNGQTIYGYFRKLNLRAFQRNGVLYLDDASQERVRAEFLKNGALPETSEELNISLSKKVESGKKPEQRPERSTAGEVKSASFDMSETIKNKALQDKKEPENVLPKSAKTFLELARELGTNKQIVYRCFKKLNLEAIQKDGVMYINEAAQSRIKAEFKRFNASGEVHQEVHHDAHHDVGLEAVVDALKEQLKAKDAQIRYLQEALRREQENVKLAQQLHGAEKVAKFPPERKKSFLPWLNKR